METSEKPGLKTLKITPESLAPILKLDKLQLQAAVRALGPFELNGELPNYVVLRVLLADMLERLAFLKPSQRQAILIEYDESYSASEFDGPPWTQLVFADGNWCSWSGHTGWFDLTTGETVTELPAPPVETIGYNLVTLCERAFAQMKARQQHAEHSAGSVDQP